jgi:hypothetical protein
MFPRVHAVPVCWGGWQPLACRRPWYGNKRRAATGVPRLPSVPVPPHTSPPKVPAITDLLLVRRYKRMRRYPTVDLELAILNAAQTAKGLGVDRQTFLNNCEEATAVAGLKDRRPDNEMYRQYWEAIGKNVGAPTPEAVISDPALAWVYSLMEEFCAAHGK